MTIDAGQVDGYCEVNGLRLHYIEWGTATAPPMLLLHGLTSHAHSWDYLAAALQDEFHIVALDQRGHGDSAWAKPAAYSTDDYVSDAISVLDSLELSRVILCGLSMGAHNSLALAARHPARVERLVAIDIGPSLQRLNQGPRQAQGPQRVFDSVDEAFALARSQNARPAEDVHRNRVERGLRRRDDGRFELKYDPEAPPQWRPDDLWQELPAIECPSLIVRGGLSPVLDSDTARRMTEAMADATLVTIEESGHSVPLDAPARLEAAVRSFLGAGVAR